MDKHEFEGPNIPKINRFYLFAYFLSNENKLLLQDVTVFLIGEEEIGEQNSQFNGIYPQVS